jgi:hypothetical protein
VIQDRNHAVHEMSSEKTSIRVSAR